MKKGGCLVHTLVSGAAELTAVSLPLHQPVLRVTAWDGAQGPATGPVRVRNRQGGSDAMPGQDLQEPGLEVDGAWHVWGLQNVVQWGQG